jgi:DNA-binding MarR family transcriptional regulator
MKILHSRNEKAANPARHPGSPDVERQARDLVACLDAMRRRMMFRAPWKDFHVELSAQDVRAFAVLADKDSMTMSDYAEALGSPLSTATHAVSRLVAKGIAERSRIEADRRVVRVQLSDKGRKMESMFRQARLAMGRDMLACLTRGEREIFLELMVKIAQGKPGAKDAER